MFVVEKSSGVMYWFDNCTRNWCGPCNLHCSDGNLYCCCIEFVNGRLILVGMILVGIVGEDENLKRMKVWEVYGECMEKLRKIGEIKEEMMIDSGENFKVGMMITGDFVLMDRLVFGYSNVGLTDLQRALTTMSVKLHPLH
ncbi:hypothetical protein HS088_TW16G00119 [Tripterygium wilfordii]|uniref:Uncharacterized protein n=1 Tax=Tripterygium wilfordii TaxID=458696 RepID=A0A7J7CI17_TRIWF|nr:hypothetical protein HS088_TW16G00119 [Tripterygium wilfordii]